MPLQTFAFHVDKRLPYLTWWFYFSNRTSWWKHSLCLRIWLEKMSTHPTGWSWIWCRAGECNSCCYLKFCCCFGAFLVLKGGGLTRAGLRIAGVWPSVRQSVQLEWLWLVICLLCEVAKRGQNLLSVTQSLVFAQTVSTEYFSQIHLLFDAFCPFQGFPPGGEPIYLCTQPLISGPSKFWAPGNSSIVSGFSCGPCAKRQENPTVNGSVDVERARGKRP